VAGDHRQCHHCCHHGILRLGVFCEERQMLGRYEIISAPVFEKTPAQVRRQENYE